MRNRADGNRAERQDKNTSNHKIHSKFSAPPPIHQVLKSICIFLECLNAWRQRGLNRKGVLFDKGFQLLRSMQVAGFEFMLVKSILVADGHSWFKAANTTHLSRLHKLAIR